MAHGDGGGKGTSSGAARASAPRAAQQGYKQCTCSVHAGSCSAQHTAHMHTHAYIHAYAYIQAYVHTRTALARTHMHFGGRPPPAGANVD